MTEIIEYQLPLIFSSDPINGASNISQNGSRFSIVFTRPLIVPRKAKYCWLTVENSTIVFNTPNILTGVNDLMKVDFDDGLGGAATFNLVLPEGLYDLDHLNAAIQQQLGNLGADTDGITLLPDTATQKVIIKYREFYQIDFTISQSFRTILGFNSRIAPVGGFAASNFYEIADNVAAFNTLEYYLIHSDLCSGHGIRIGPIYSDTIQQVPISDTAAGGTISYEPQNLQKIPCPNLIGQSLREINCWLTDNQNQFVDTLGETWSTRVNIHYLIDLNEITDY